MVPQRYSCDTPWDPMEWPRDSNMIEHFRKRPKRANTQLPLRVRIIYEHGGVGLRARTHHNQPLHAKHQILLPTLIHLNPH